MNVVEQRPGDQLDELMHAYFRKEMPAPWPAFQPARRRPTPPVRSAEPIPRSLWRSRLALAASVGLLAVSLALLPGKFLAPSGPEPALPIAGAGTANTEVLPHKAKSAPLPRSTPAGDPKSR
jgi:hypothetical protein